MQRSFKFSHRIVGKVFGEYAKKKKKIEGQCAINSQKFGQNNSCLRSLERKNMVQKVKFDQVFKNT